MPLPTETSTALARLDSAGVVQFGVLNMAEFALGPTGHNWSKGHCRNPWNTERISGGSSSGSAASVAARVNFGALGSDTGGSIRGPAGICGITGLKTTYGRVSRAGTMGLSYSLDTIGPLARSALDCAMIMNAVAGSDPADPSTWAIASTDYVANIKKSIGGLKLGIPTNYFFDEIDSGTGGKTAKMIGINLKELSKSMQVILITHQPQIVAISDNIFKVTKEFESNKTILSAKYLKEHEVENEISYMISGDQCDKKQKYPSIF
jgi:aspartyl-tRNA(Asn)/glutamyl-tRNA(Gln) amidotransferase subunit A